MIKIHTLKISNFLPSIILDLNNDNEQQIKSIGKMKKIPGKAHTHSKTLLLLSELPLYPIIQVQVA